MIQRLCARFGLTPIGSLGLICLFAFGSSAIAASRPNILMVLMDDVGWGDIHSYNANSKVSLPAIERLAEGGVRFTDAHTSAAKCAPSRYSIITGNYQWRGKSSWGQWDYKGGSQLRVGQDSLGDALRRADYVTAMVGKYHLGAQFYKKNSTQFATGSDLDTAVDFERAMLDGPAQHGFDYSFLAMRGIQAGPYAFFENGLLYGNSADLITWNAGDYGDTAFVKAGIGLPNWVTRNVGPTLLSKSLDFLETHQRTQASAGVAKPFFLYFNTEAVHGPRKPPVAIGDRYVLGSSGIGDRGDMLVEIDAIVQKLQLKLEQLGLLDNTLIILTSDNGANIIYPDTRAGHYAVGPFRGYKTTIYEGGHRVPLILKWGPRAFGSSPLAPGSASNALVGTQDLIATLAELVGVPLAADQGRDSVSFLPILMGQATTVRDRIISEADEPDQYAPDGGISGRHFAYRSQNWKLIFNSSRLPLELYDLGLDPREEVNLISRPEHAGRVATMKSALENSLTSERTAPIMTGPGEVTVPSVVGMTQPAAATVITEAGLSVGTIKQQSSATAPAGRVISQSPTAGTSATAASPVNLVVSSGPGSAAVYTFSVSPTSLAFGNLALGQKSSNKTVTITNTGTVVLPITSITLAGTNPYQFTQTNNCPAQVPVGGKCRASVAFKPTSAGIKSASLKVTPGGGVSAKSVVLNGSGI